MYKKLISIMLVLAMAFSLSTPVMAASITFQMSNNPGFTANAFESVDGYYVGSLTATRTGGNGSNATLSNNTGDVEFGTPIINGTGSGGTTIIPVAIKQTESIQTITFSLSINKVVTVIVSVPALMIEKQPADYSAVEAAIAAANALNKDLYVDFSGVDAAIAAVVPGLDVTEQAIVDGFAAAINSAVEELVLKGVSLVSLSATPSNTSLQNSTTITITVKGLYDDGSTETLASASVKLKQSGTQIVKIGDFTVTVVVNSNNKITSCTVNK